jgi:hypothetical protein
MLRPGLQAFRRFFHTLEGRLDRRKQRVFLNGASQAQAGLKEG